jgi:hypothetical protein
MGSDIDRQLLNLGIFEKINVHANAVELELTLQSLEKLIKLHIPSAIIERKGDEIYIIVPLKSLLRYEIYGDIVKLVIPVNVK